MSLALELKNTAEKALIGSINAEKDSESYKDRIQLFKERAAGGSKHCFIDLHNPVKRLTTLEALKSDGFNVTEVKSYRFKIGWE